MRNCDDAGIKVEMKLCVFGETFLDKAFKKQSDTVHSSIGEHGFLHIFVENTFKISGFLLI